jgi:hypothetical protein
VNAATQAGITDELFGAGEAVDIAHRAQSMMARHQ